MENEIRVLIGAPGSGKTTYAQKLLGQRANLVKVSRDDIRWQLKGKYMVSEEIENTVSAIQDSMIKSLLDRKHDIVLDNTHCKIKYIEEIIRKYGNQARIVLDIVGAELSIKEIKKQNLQREKVVPETVIDNMYKGFTHVVKNKKELNEMILKRSIDPSPADARPQDKSLPKAILFDIDGTVAHMENKRGPFEWHKVDSDAPDENILNLARTLSTFYKVVFMSGRDESCRELTEAWLNVYYKGDEPVELYMREAGNFEKDSKIKRELFDKHIRDKYYIEAVFDDRDQVVEMWRKELGLKCLQVNYGNF